MMFGRRVRRVDNECVLRGARARCSGREVFFYDDNFIMSKPRTKALLAEMIRRRMKITFTRADPGGLHLPAWQGGPRTAAAAQGGRLLHGLPGPGIGESGAVLDAFNKQMQVSDMAKGSRGAHARTAS